ncbi:MAG: O-antigen ligase family protein [Bacteroidota bacterium]
MKFFSRPVDSHALACALMIAVGISVLISPPLMNLFEFLLVAVILSSVELRQRLWATWRSPMVKFILLFYAIIIVGTTYSIAPANVTFRMALGWHKLLLLPIALSLFGEADWKTRFLSTFISAVTLAAALSFALWLAGIALPVSPNEPGVFLRNHATQGMAFAMGAFGAVLLAREKVGARRVWLACAALLVANIAIVTPGRSGYMVLVVATVVAVLAYLFAARQRLGARQILGAGLVVAGVVGVLLLAPSRSHIEQGLNEVQQYDQTQELTSMGIRMIFWRNAIELIKERPLLGYGTGAFGEAYGRLVAGRGGLAETPAGDPHNQYMKITAENGVFALFAFLGFLVAALRQRCAAPWRVLGLGVLAAWCATSLFNSHFSTFNEGNLIYVWLGVMLAAPGRAEQETLSS